MVNRISFIISSLAAGGAERVMSNMANYWAGKGKEINLITFDEGVIPPFYELAGPINHISLRIAKNSPNFLLGFLNNLRRVMVLKKAICDSKPEVVISFLDQTNVITLLAARKLKIPILVMEQSDPFLCPISTLWARMRLWTYPWASGVVVLNERARSYFPRKIRENTAIIPNPVLIPESEAVQPLSLPRPLLVAMGRLSEEKCFDLLLKAFALLKNRQTNWTLFILGDGPLREELQCLAHELGLASRVHFTGIVKNPYELLKQADLFVLTSRFEGFPVALCEAMACGLAVVSTEYHKGVHEIIRDGVNGLIVPPGDAGALASALNRLMENEPERKRLGLQALGIVEQVGLEKVMTLWEELLEEVGRRR